MNLTLVLDRSTSMRGVRLDKVKIAAHHIIDQLSPQDVLAVVSFSDRADVLIPATSVTDKASLRSAVSIMRADGGTEIYHGLAAGVAECRRYLAAHGQPCHPADGRARSATSAAWSWLARQPKTASASARWALGRSGTTNSSMRWQRRPVARRPTSTRRAVLSSWTSACAAWGCFRRTAAIDDSARR